MIAVAVADGLSLRPAVVDVESGAMRVLVERNLTLPGTKTFFHWIDDATLACEVTVGNRPTLWLDVEKRGAMASIANWHKAWKGQEATASPLTTDQPETVLEEAEYCVIDVGTGRYDVFSREGPRPDRLEAFDGRPEPDYPPRVVGPGKPVPPQSILAATHPEGSEAIYLTRSDDATRVLRLARDKPHVIFETDTHMAEVVPSRSFTMPFATGAGQEAQLRVILPPDYREGESRPAVLWVYPGFKAGSEMAHRQHLLNQPGMFNLHLLAARGYVVIIPSMPYDENGLGVERVLADCLIETAHPACDAVVAAGYVDRARIHVAGHSLGGWATMVLLTKSEAFRSGIAMAGTSNLLSQTDDVRLRFDAIVDDSRAPGMSSNYHLKCPPWERLDSYLRNSPLFSVEQISAPLLIIHGDQDYVEIGQSEQMFAALRSLGKPAEFVRYWGEGHVFESPANIRDAWERIILWLERAH
ncbi:S9 family peptidase [Pseudohoeflea suaedae]|uniref:S9 family peptidase n=1 Tax=Pseudohoeflea suaedae TaxID=877384 RepID=A0A4V3A757_9HYPH|nr:prolyl oligopeptidase family serine peptidase [Pseudohoeflea suaedae]TDH36292.1 S9 family peptidase [Pseudohoeflea suaedae]